MLRIPEGWEGVTWLLLCAAYVVAIAPHLDYPPLWDGYNFFSQCYMKSAEKGTLDCFNHSSFLPTALYGLTQRISYGNPTPVNAINAALGLASAAALAAILRRFLGHTLSGVEIALLSFCLAFNPIFIVHSVFPVIDYPLPLLVMLLILALYGGRYALAASLGLAMSFVKEPGIMLYAVMAFLYAAKTYATGGWRARPGRAGLLALSVPLIVYAIYMALHPPHGEHTYGYTWEGVLGSLVSMDFKSEFFKTQMITLYVMSYSWVMSSVIALGLTAQAAGLLRRDAGLGKGGFSDRGDKLFFYLLLALTTFFSTRVIFASNPRYMMQLLPLTVILFAEASTIIIKRRWARKILYLTVIALLYSSQTMTFDPVSMHLLGTFRFGEREMYCKPSFNIACTQWAGRDELVYNFEVLDVGYLTEYAILTLGTDKTYVLHELAASPGHPDLCTLDLAKGQRTADRKNGFLARCYTARDLLKTVPPDELYYISLPMISSSDDLTVLRSRYSPVDSLEFKLRGHSIQAIRFRLTPHSPQEAT